MKKTEKQATKKESNNINKGETVEAHTIIVKENNSNKLYCLLQGEEKPENIKKYIINGLNNEIEFNTLMQNTCKLFDLSKIDLINYDLIEI